MWRIEEALERGPKSKSARPMNIWLISSDPDPLTANTPAELPSPTAEPVVESDESQRQFFLGGGGGVAVFQLSSVSYVL